MRKILFTVAAAASALVVASPAAAQYYPAPAYGTPAYGAPYGNAYGYRYGGQQWARELQQIRMQADALGRAGRLTRSEARDLYRDLRSAENSLYRAGRNGFSRNEARSMENKIARIRYEMRRYSDRDYRRWRR